MESGKLEKQGHNNPPSTVSPERKSRAATPTGPNHKYVGIYTKGESREGFCGCIVTTAQS